MRKWLLVVIACSSCGKSKATCRAEAAELGAYLSSIDRSMSGTPVSVELVTRNELPPLEDYGSPVVELDAHQRVKITPGRSTGTTLDDARGALQATRATWLEQTRQFPHAPDGRKVVVAIDAAAPWADVDRLLHTLAEVGFDQPRFELAGAPDRVPPPPPSKIDGDLDAVMAADPSERATSLAKVMTGVVADCKALQRAFASVGSEENGDKSGTLIAAIPPALVDCQCQVDLDALRTSFYRLLHNDHPVRALAVELTTTGTAIQAAPTAHWRDIAPTLHAGPLALH